MFFSKSKLVLYIRKSSLELYFKDRAEKLDFPANVLSNIEVKDKPNYVKLINDFLGKLNLVKQKAVIILADEIVFAKNLPLDSKDRLAVEIQQFIDSVPFNNEEISLKRVQTNDGLTIFTTNKEIYESLLEILAELSWQIKAVAPLNLFKTRLSLISDNIDPEIALQIISQKDLIDVGNFLSETTGQLGVAKQSKSYSITLLLLLGLILISGTSFLMATTFGIVKNPLEIVQNRLFKSEVKAPVQSGKPLESTGSASPKSDQSKEGLTIQVLNGSGITGQAGKVKSALELIGFKDIKTGNAVGTGTSETIVVFSNQIPAEIQEEVITELEKTFSKVSVQDEASETEFDILITTGRDLVE